MTFCCVFCVVCLLLTPSPRSTRTDTLFPYTTCCRSQGDTGMPETIQSQVQAGTIHWRRSLRTHVALWSGALAAVVLLLIFVAAALLLRERIVDDAQRDTRASTRAAAADRKSVAQGKRVAVRVDLGGRRSLNKT